ncbi:MAG TPA: hypothetical protein VMZ52_01680 [Bryobacteraceae bacterium]|nr:hypothetical protein [Bryobacteraceae bacterium]
MRPQDKLIFASAAADPPLKLWILVRRTNPASLSYIGRPGFTPKRIDCKAKTAEEGKIAGLVVDYSIHKDLFSPKKQTDAERCWEAFQEVLHAPKSSYAVNRTPASEYFGCVTLGGSYIHGDYDLYDLIDPLQARRNLAACETMLGMPHRRGPYFLRVQEFVNTRIGVDMVQHGGEAQYADFSEQSIDVFGPNREQCTILNEYSVRGWYKNLFEDRPMLGARQPPGPRHE